MGSYLSKSRHGEQPQKKIRTRTYSGGSTGKRFTLFRSLSKRNDSAAMKSATLQPTRTGDGSSKGSEVVTEPLKPALTSTVKSSPPPAVPPAPIVDSVPPVIVDEQLVEKSAVLADEVITNATASIENKEPIAVVANDVLPTTDTPGQLHFEENPTTERDEQLVEKSADLADEAITNATASIENKEPIAVVADDVLPTTDTPGQLHFEENPLNISKEQTVIDTTPEHDEEVDLAKEFTDDVIKTSVVKVQLEDQPTTEINQESGAIPDVLHEYESGENVETFHLPSTELPIEAHEEQVVIKDEEDKGNFVQSSPLDVTGEQLDQELEVKPLSDLEMESQQPQTKEREEHESIDENEPKVAEDVDGACCQLESSHPTPRSDDEHDVVGSAAAPEPEQKPDHEESPGYSLPQTQMDAHEPVSIACSLFSPPSTVPQREETKIEEYTLCGQEPASECEGLGLAPGSEKHLSVEPISGSMEAVVGSHEDDVSSLKFEDHQNEMHLHPSDDEQCTETDHHTANSELEEAASIRSEDKHIGPIIAEFETQRVPSDVASDYFEINQGIEEQQLSANGMAQNGLLNDSIEPATESNEPKELSDGILSVEILHLVEDNECELRQASGGDLALDASHMEAVQQEVDVKSELAINEEITKSEYGALREEVVGNNESILQDDLTRFHPFNGDLDGNTSDVVAGDEISSLKPSGQHPENRETFET